MDGVHYDDGDGDGDGGGDDDGFDDDDDVVVVMGRKERRYVALSEVEEREMD